MLAWKALFVLGVPSMRTFRAVVMLAFAAASLSRAIELQVARQSPFDLEVCGKLAGVPAGQSRYVRWEDLRALPTTKLRLDGEFVKGPQELTVVFLSDLWNALPSSPGADTLLATCGDGYSSIYTSDFISRYKPFLVLEINGQGPAKWPPPGLAFNPGPYVITVSTDLVPAAAGYLDLPHKKPWGTKTNEVAAYAERLSGFYSGKWASLTPTAAAGREIWINSCACCHQGPDGQFGGTKSGRPFQVLAAYATYDKAFFMKYVRDPKSLVAGAKMEAHPWYTDEQLSHLIEFITAGN